MRLHPVVRHDPVGVGARHRGEHDVLDAGPPSGVKERVQGGPDTSDGRRSDQEQTADPPQRRRERLRRIEVQVGHRPAGEDPLQDFGIRPGWAHGDPGGGEGAGDRSTDIAGRAGDEDIARHGTGSITSR